MGLLRNRSQGREKPAGVNRRPLTSHRPDEPIASRLVFLAGAEI